MSEMVEVERRRSIAVSSLSAWLALLAGMGLIMATFFLVTERAYLDDPDRGTRQALRESMLRDLLVSVPDSFVVSTEGKSLEFLISKGKEASREVVVYRQQGKSLVRESQNSGKARLGHCSADLDFELEASLLKAHWGRKRTDLWAVKR